MLILLLSAHSVWRSPSRPGIVHKGATSLRSSADKQLGKDCNHGHPLAATACFGP